MIAIDQTNRPGTKRTLQSRTVHRGWQVRPAGVVLVALAGLVLLAAMNNQQNLLFWVFGALMAVFVLSAFVSWVLLRPMTVRRLDPRHGAVGEPLLVRYLLTNTSFFLPAFNIHIQEQSLHRRPVPLGRVLRRLMPMTRRFDRRNNNHIEHQTTAWNDLMGPASAWVMHVGPGQQVHGEAVFWPRRRGQAHFDRVTIASPFPFGLFRRVITFSQPQHTLIYPTLYEMRHGFLRALTPSGRIGATIANRPGPGDDYFGLREYRPGDGLRHVCWKRSAQRDELIVVERTHPSPPKLRVALDLTSPTETLTEQLHGDAVAARHAEEQAISLTASIVHAADHAGYEIGLSVAGLHVPGIRVRRDRRHVSRIMATLAGLNLDQPRLDNKAEVIPEVDQAALIVVHPTRPEPPGNRPDAWAFKGRDIETYVTRPIGWPPPETDIEEPPVRNSESGSRREEAPA